MDWKIDPAHSHFGFSVKHMGIATVRGRFKEATGTVTSDDSNRPTRAHVEIQAESIDTGEPQRDTHLRSEDFFGSESNPNIVFDSTSFTPTGDGKYRIEGNLSMKGQTHPVTLEAEVTGPSKDPWGGTRVAAEVTGKINRKDWGINWNQVMEFGGFLVGEEVKLQIEIEAIVAQPAQV